MYLKPIIDNVKKVIVLHYVFFCALLRIPPSRSGGKVFPYHSGNSLLLPFILIITFLTPIEIVVLFLVVPHNLSWIRDILLFASIEALILTWGLYFSINRYPHIVDDKGIQLRWSNLVSFHIPYNLIHNVEVRKDREPNGHFGVTFHPKLPQAYLSNSGDTNVTLKLKDKVVIPAWLTPTKPVEQLHLSLMDPIVFAQTVDEAVRNSKDWQPVDMNTIVGKPVSSGLTSTAVILLSLIFEVPFFLIGWFWIQKQGFGLFDSLGISASATLWGVVIGLAGALFTVCGLVFSAKRPFLSKWREWFLQTLAPFLGKSNPLALLIVALSAGIGEEVLFRGAMQPVIGVFPTALIFAVIHIGKPRREALSFFIYVFLYGLALGLLRRQGVALFSLIFAHFLIDFLTSLYLTTTVKRKV